MEQINNDTLTLTISEHGAELQSIRDAKGQEYLWDGDEHYWNRHSPILFPLVCGLWQDTYRIDGKEYHLSRHGFARDTDFKVVRKSADRITFALSDSEETLKVYPYHFNLAISYRLEGNKIHVVWHVENTDRQTIFFQIGGHPAFLVPGARKGEPLRGRLRFDNPRPERLYGNDHGCIVKGYHPIETDNGVWVFTEDMFRDDALIFDRSQIRHIEILDDDDKAVVTVDCKTPALGIWSPAGKHAPFVCIEPWYGIHDWAGYQGEFKDKYLMNQLLPGASFMSEYTITIG
ncbi:aldose 1-epimerase family protein [Prevotella sp. AGR2160]|uniref:aldose 1-epimerase family protein n=1 Tax=Prevotella sp. AGR2160 TaxID=1280674 RepID=UPI000416D210|nr:aldose 1-epimerase family protein [Prevotella sp. AGR2160]